jgi:hypothetical protein
MFLQSVVFIITTLLLSGCLPQINSVVKMPSTRIIKTLQKRATPQFNQVVVVGKVNIILHTGYKKSSVVLHGGVNDLSQVRIVVQNNQLVITSDLSYAKLNDVTIDIYTNHLNAFTYRGVGLIEGTYLSSNSLDLILTNPGHTLLRGRFNLHRFEINGPGFVEIDGVKTKHLQLKMHGNPHVKLRGTINLSSLYLDGQGWLDLYWIKSNHLTIRAKEHSFIQLAGVTNQLDLELWDYAIFNSRYLRAKKTFAKTHDHSIASITALDKQHTLANDASDIYFYKIPNMKTDFMAYAGAVLDMRDWNRYEQRDYDNYNK